MRWGETPAEPDMITVEPERRQWGAWNFVGFWISDSFNIVCGRPVGDWERMLIRLRTPG